MQSFSEYISSQNLIASNLRGSDSLDKLIESISGSASNPNSIVFTIGNGGSASTAEHFSADLAQMEKRTGHAVRSFCLNSQIALSSAFANDHDYSTALSDQLASFKGSNYILVAFSASGNSKNILSAVNFSLAAGKEVHCFVGFSGGEVLNIEKVNVIYFPDSEKNYGIAENLHLTATHYVVDRLIEKFAVN
jgi:D-sedoheptulose 7-phosphate isomerase